jgi:hypothetical protein
MAWSQNAWSQFSYGANTLDSTVAFSGWNSSIQSWNSGSWGEQATDTAFSANGAVSGVTIIFEIQAAPVGQVATTGISGVTVSTGTGVSTDVTGIEATSALGSVLVWGRVVPGETATWTEMVVN